MAGQGPAMIPSTRCYSKSAFISPQVAPSVGIASRFVKQMSLKTTLTVALGSPPRAHSGWK